MKLFLPILLALAAFAQTHSVSDTSGTGKADNSAAIHTLPAKVVATVPDLPSSGCTPGEVAIVLAANPGQQLYGNSGTGTCVWTQQLGGTAAGPAGPAGPPGPAGPAGAPGAAGYSPNTLLSGGIVIWTGGYSFTASAATYLINNTQYTSPQTSVTLAAPSATAGQDRFDVVVVNTSGAVAVIQGATSSTPAIPDVNPATQLYLTAVLVSGATSQPVSVANTNIYQENAGPSTEWTATKSGTPINLASASNPYVGTYDIEATAAATNNYANFQAAATFDPATSNYLVFYLRSKASWDATRQLQLRLMTGATARGSIVVFNQSAFGFDSGVTTTYQQIVIPLALFAANGVQVDTLRITVAGSGGTIGFYLDDITLQSGLPQPGAGAYLATPTVYSTTTTYPVNSLVTYLDGSWVAVASNTNSPPSCASANWVTLTPLICNTQTANTVYAGPASGAAAAPGFRAPVLADVSTGAGPSFSATPTFSLSGLIQPGVMTASVSSVTLTNKPANAKFSIHWTQADLGVLTATYVSGITASGTGNCSLGTFNGGGSGATATIAIATGTPGAITITAPGSGYALNPTTAVSASGTATCSGTAVITSTINGPYEVTYGASVSNTPCAVSHLANAWTEHTFEVANDGATVTAIDCKSSDPQLTLNSPSLGASPITETWTVGTGGVVANTLVEADASSPSLIVAATTGVYGVAMTTVAAGGTVEVARYGTVSCVTDTGGSTANDLVIIGTGSPINCQDSGETSSANIPTTTRIVGAFRSTATAGNTALVELTPAHFGTQAGGGVPATGANGIVICTGTSCSTAATRSLAGTTNETAITNADGTAGNPTIGLAAAQKTRPCVFAFSGTSSGGVLQSGDDLIAATLCENDFGASLTISEVDCWTDAGAGVTITPTVGGSAILSDNSGTLTCGAGHASKATDLNIAAASQTAGQVIAAVMGGTLTGAHVLNVVVWRTLP